MEMKTKALIASILATASLGAAQIDRVIVRQQWPWSTNVKVEYMISGVTAPVDIGVKAYNGNVELDSSRLAAAITGDRFGITEDGVRAFTIDPVKAFGTEKVALANFRVALTIAETSALDLEPVYRIIDLETKTVTDLSRSDFYNGGYGTYETDFSKIGENYTTSEPNVFIWTGVTNDIAYKTTKLVMRRIPAKNKTFTMGGANDWKSQASDNFANQMTLTNDFWLAVFETTRKQSLLLQGYDASSLTDDVVSRPAYQFKNATATVAASYEQIRGLPSSWVGWPGDVLAVSDDCALQRMRARFPGLRFDLPTETQWEFACRAGTTTMYYTGVDPERTQAAYTAELASLAWSSETGSGVAAEEVGLLRPNAFGLYDMLGNVGELVRDVYNPDTLVGSSNGPEIPAAGAEPMGWADAAAVAEKDGDCYILFRGNNWARDYTWCKCANRRAIYKLSTNAWSGRFGARLWLPVE